MVDTGLENEESESIFLLNEFLADMAKLDNQTFFHNADEFAGSNRSELVQAVDKRVSKMHGTVKPTTEPQKKKIHSWLRRKHELEALRRQTQELETRVAFLVLQQEKRRLQLGLSREQFNMLYTNKRAADKESQKLQEAQNENAALKRDFRAYVRASTSWQAAVSAAVRETDALDILLPMNQAALETGVLQQLQISSLSTFNQLEERVNKRFLGFQTILDEIAQASVSLDKEQVQTYREDNDTTSYNFTRVLPFDEMATLNAAWSIVQEGGITQKQASNVIRRSKDVHAVDSRFVLPIVQGEFVAIDIHCVVKRFEVPGGCVLLAEGRSESSAYRGHSILWRQESQESVWFVIRRLPFSASKVHSDSYPASECQMKAVVRSEALHPCSSDCTQSAPLVFVDDLAVSSFRELIDSQQQCWENLLWDSVRAANKYHP